MSDFADSWLEGFRSGQVTFDPPITRASGDAIYSAKGPIIVDRRGFSPAITNPTTYGTPATAYQTHRQAVTRQVFYVPNAIKNLRVGFANIRRSGTSPVEVAFNALEVGCSLQIITSETSLTAKSDLLPFYFGNRRIQYLAPGNVLVSHPLRNLIPAGSWIQMLTYGNRLASTGSTILGEPGQLASTSANWPQQVNIGGMLNAGFCGSEINGTDTLSTTMADKLDSGSLTINSQSGFGPSFVTGDIVGKQNVPTIGIWGDSLTVQGNNDQVRTDQAFSGRNFVIRGLGHDFPSAHFGAAGTAAQSNAQNFLWNWRARAEVVFACDTVFIEFGNNDCAALRNPDLIISDLNYIIQAMRAGGVRRVVAGTITCRYLTNDGGQSNGGFSEYTVGSNAVIDAVNDKIISGQLERDDYMELRPAVQQGLGGSKWKLSQLLASTTVAAGTTASAVNFASTVLGGADLRGYCMRIGAESRLININSGGNSASVYATPFTFTPTVGQTVEIVAQICDDGVHYTNVGHELMAASFRSQNYKLLIPGS